MSKMSKTEFHIIWKNVPQIFRKIWKFQFHKKMEISITQNCGNLNSTKNTEISIPQKYGNINAKL